MQLIFIISALQNSKIFQLFTETRPAVIFLIHNSFRVQLAFLSIAHSRHVLDPKQTEKKRGSTRERNKRGTPAEH